MIKGLTCNKAKGGMWYISKVYKGHRLAQSTKTKDLKEAEKIAADMFKEFRVKIDKQIESSKVKKISSLIDEFYNFKWKHNDDGEQSYRQAKAVIAYMGDLPIDKFQPDVLASYRVKLDAEEKFSAATVNRYMSAIRAPLNYAFKCKYIAAPPIVQIVSEQGRLRIITRAELQKLYEAFFDCHLRAGGETGMRIAIFLVETGCRLEDAIQCTWERNIDLEDGGYVTFAPSKRGNGRRIPMTHTLFSMLNGGWTDEEKTGRLFEGITKYNFEDAWDWCRRRIGLETDVEFVPHALRHTCASRLAANGCSLIEIGSWLGHKNYQTTQKYAHLVKGHLEHARDQLNAATARLSRRNRNKQDQRKQPVRPVI